MPLQVHIDVDMDNEVDYILFNTGMLAALWETRAEIINPLRRLDSFHFSGVFTPFADHIGCVIRNKKTNEIICTGFAPDHSTNTANTILRVCSNDIGFPTPPTKQTQINVYILTATATHLGVTEVTDLASEQFLTIGFPQAWISAPSYDIYPGETLETLRIDGTGGNGSDRTPLGLILITNSYRGPDNTGAATRESEALILTVGEQTIPTEVSPDELGFPVAEAFEGPACAAWKETGATCATAIARSFLKGSEISTNANSLKKVYKIYSEGESTESLSSNGDDGDQKIGQTDGALDSLLDKLRQDEDETSKCPEVAVPRSAVLRVSTTAPTAAPETPATRSPTSMTLTTQNPTTQSNSFQIGPTQNVASETISPVLTAAPDQNSTALQTTPAQIVTKQTAAPMASAAQNHTTQSNTPSALPVQNLTTTMRPPSSQTSTNGSTSINLSQIDLPTVVPTPAASPNSNAPLSPSLTMLPTPARTPQSGSPGQAGPLGAAIIMVGAGGQQRDRDPPGLPFISHGASHFSLELTVGLGLALSLLAQLG
jgi:hypothetical protein